MNLETIRERIGPDMIWRSAALRQIEAFKATAGLVEVAMATVDTHRSKSIDLPVVAFEHHGRFVTMLDNFHELALHYRGPPVALTYGQCGYRPVDVDAYRELMAKCESYSWLGWSEEEIRDPRITRVEVTHPNGNRYWSETDIGRKTRWLARHDSAEWYSRDWSSGALLGNVAAVLAGREHCLWESRSTWVNDSGPYGSGRQMFSLCFASDSATERAGLIRQMLGVSGTAAGHSGG